MADDVKEYGYELQKLFLDFLVSNRDLAARCQNVLDPDHFDRRLRSAAEFIKTYVNEHGNIPDVTQVKATTNTELSHLETQAVEHSSWFLAEFEGFARHKALEKAILQSADMLDKSQYGAVEKLIKDAVQVGLPKTFGTDYFADPSARLNALKNNNGQLTTGWKALDDKLYGGFNRGELNIFAGASGAGKSLFLQNLALNWSMAGLNTVYFSLELSEGLCAMRMDAMLTDTPTREVFKRLEDVDLKVRMNGKKAGVLQIVQLTNGITANDILSWVREFQTQRKIKVDAILVDYLDLMMPASQKISVSDMFVKDKLVAEELRNLVVSEQLLLATASQLNRSAVESVEFDHSMIAGGLSKIQTADNVFGIFSTPTMRERCMVQLQFMKTRSSGAVGQKIDLSFNPDTLRISDMDGDQGSGTTKPGDVYDKLKRNTMGTPINTSAPTSTKWEKPQAREGFELGKPAGPLDVLSAPWADQGDNSVAVAKKPLTAPVASNSNRDALRAIVSREI
jgi:KaiC/GvpD/RAD55 family RecA-like ATPase